MCMPICMYSRCGLEKFESVCVTLFCKKSPISVCLFCKKRCASVLHMYTCCTFFTLSNGFAWHLNSNCPFNCTRMQARRHACTHAHTHKHTRKQ